MTDNKNSSRILRRPEVERTSGYGRSSIYALVKKGMFPAPIKIGPRAVGWSSHEIEQWIADRLAQRGAKQ